MTSFDERARDWDANPTRVELARAVAKAIRERVPLNFSWSALDYGCGTGLVSFALADELGAITLADSSAGMLAVLGEKIAASGIEHLRPVALDLTAGAPPADRFDLVFSSMALHHVNDPAALLGVLGEMIVPGGWLAIADLDPEDGSFHGPDVTDVHHGFDRAGLTHVVEEAGFSSVTFATAHRIVRGVGAEAREYSVFLLTARR